MLVVPLGLIPIHIITRFGFNSYLFLVFVEQIGTDISVPLLPIPSVVLLEEFMSERSSADMCKLRSTNTTL